MIRLVKSIHVYRIMNSMGRFLSLYLAIFLISGAASENVEVKCPLRRGSCESKVLLYEGKGTELSISCICKFDKLSEISVDLRGISEMKCAHVPRSDSPLTSRLLRSSLSIQNCSVSKEAFPVELLKLFRRAEKVTIDVRGAKELRLDRDLTPEPVSPYMTATFENSEINGFMEGWFSGSANLSLSVKNSKIGVISESAFLFGENSNVEIAFDASDILTTKSRAFKLPPEGTLEIKGGQIDQWETKAYQGGKRLTLEGVKFLNIQALAFNLHGVEELNMEACFVASVQEVFLYERDLDVGFPGKRQNKITIVKNTILKTHSMAFAGLCREKHLEFYDNYLGSVNGPIKLREDSCSTNRDWTAATNYTLMKCDDQCSSYLSSLDEQVCSVYRTTWCVDCPFEDSDKSVAFYTGDSYKSKCLTHFADFVWKNCPSGKWYSYEAKCTEKLNGKTLTLKAGAGSVQGAQKSEIIKITILLIAIQIFKQLQL